MTTAGAASSRVGPRRARTLPNVRRLEAAFGSAVFLVVAPGMAAGLVPWLLTGWRSSNPPASVAVLGAALIALGAGVLLDAFRRFVVEGRGTPAPIAFPERLIVGGLYRHVRNRCTSPWARR